MNVGEELCGEWLRHVKRCEFVQYNIRTTATQGELDVLGINLKDRAVYACEVAVHLITGLQYVRENQPDNIGRLSSKFRRDIEFVRSAFPDYRHVFMLWSPVVKDQRAGSKHNQLNDVRQIVAVVERDHGIALETIVNERFLETIEALRAVATIETKELDSSVMRFLQMEAHLRKHLRRKSVDLESVQSTGTNQNQP